MANDWCPENDGAYRAELACREDARSEIARLQEQVETLRKERDTEAAFAAVRAKYLKEAEAERDRLRAQLEGRDKFIVDQCLWAAFVASLPAALQKEPQP